jgi:adenylate cyclase
MLNLYMTPMAEIIISSQGTIDKYIGDAIMAYWNAPANVPHHADRAVRSALAQLETLKKINADLRKRGWPALEIGIGINSGPVIVGEMGSKGRSDYTITGDNVNLASRIEGLNKYYGTHLLISEKTREKLAGGYTVREVDRVRVRGSRQPVTLFEVLAKGTPFPALAEELRRHDEALALYRQARFREAHTLFLELEARHPCPLYRLYLERTRAYMKRPPPRFDGIHTFTEKYEIW